MPKEKRLRHGIGAKVSVYTKFLHPRALVCSKYPHASKRDVLNELHVVGQEEKTVNKRLQTCLTMRHADFDDGQLLYAVTRFCRVEQEGAPEHLFNDPSHDNIEDGEGVAAAVEEESLVLEVVPTIFHEDASNFRALGFVVDDDNEPAPENIPHPNDDTNECTYLDWGAADRIDIRRAAGITDVLPRMVRSDATMHTILGFFFHFLPVEYIKKTLIPATNSTLSDPLTYEEILRFLGLVFIMATTQTTSARGEFWSNDAPDIFCGAPFRLHSYMSRRRFELILKHLKFTKDEPPAFKDPFHPIRPLIDAFNRHTQHCFSPGWINCLDESMSVWTNQWTCPGWIFVPRKRHPMGNEYHSLCCGLSGIMYAIELVEGTHRPKELGPKQYSDLGETTALLLRLTDSIHHSGRVVIMNSGFCVLKALVKLSQYGVYGSAVVKKRRFWPKYVKVEDIDRRFEGKEVGSVDSLPGFLNNLPFRIFCMKEEDYVMKLMATYGVLKPVDNGETKRSVTENGQSVNKTFLYTEPFYNHFKFRHQVDDHNNLRHSPISLEESMSTSDWNIRVFMFVIALVEVNARLAFAYFLDSPTMNQLEFRRKLAQELIEYSHVVNGGERGKRKRTDTGAASTCAMETAPQFAGAWTGTEWQFLSSRYPQHVCRTLNCKKRIRTYCRCMIGHWMCPTCIGIHIASKGVDSW